jgi:hypothetical protein
VISRLAYAVLRAVLVVILVSIPSLLIPGVSPDTARSSRSLRCSARS